MILPYCSTLERCKKFKTLLQCKFFRICLIFLEFFGFCFTVLNKSIFVDCGNESQWQLFLRHYSKCDAIIRAFYILILLPSIPFVIYSTLSPYNDLIYKTLHVKHKMSNYIFANKTFSQRVIFQFLPNLCVVYLCYRDICVIAFIQKSRV